MNFPRNSTGTTRFRTTFKGIFSGFGIFLGREGWFLGLGLGEMNKSGLPALFSVCSVEVAVEFWVRWLLWVFCSGEY